MKTGKKKKDTNHVSKVKLSTLVEGDPKASFLISTTVRCRGGRYSFSWIVPFYFAFLKFTSCDNLALVGCIPIRAVAVDLKLKS